MRPTLSTVAFVAILCLLAFAAGERRAESDAKSPCRYTFEQRGATYCVMTERAARIEARS